MDRRKASCGEHEWLTSWVDCGTASRGATRFFEDLRQFAKPVRAPTIDKQDSLTTRHTTPRQHATTPRALAHPTSRRTLSTVSHSYTPAETHHTAMSSPAAEYGSNEPAQDPNKQILFRFCSEW